MRYAVSQPGSPPRKRLRFLVRRSAQRRSFDGAQRPPRRSPVLGLTVGLIVSAAVIGCSSDSDGGAASADAPFARLPRQFATDLRTSVVGTAAARFNGYVTIEEAIDPTCLQNQGTRIDALRQRREVNIAVQMGSVEEYVERFSDPDHALVTYRFTGTKRVVDEPWVRLSDGAWYFADCDRIEEELLPAR